MHQNKRQANHESVATAYMPHTGIQPIMVAAYSFNQSTVTWLGFTPYPTVTMMEMLYCSCYNALKQMKSKP